jgi:hypothetical protein
VVNGIEGTEIPPITRDHYHKAGFTLPAAAIKLALPLEYSIPGFTTTATTTTTTRIEITTNITRVPTFTSFDTRADRHTRHTAGLGGLDDFLASDVCVFHDFTSPKIVSEWSKA